MFDWFAENWGTLLTGAVVLLMVTAILRFFIRSRRKGNSACGCSGGCAGCAQCGSCHPQKQKTRLSSK